MVFIPEVKRFVKGGGQTRPFRALSIDGFQWAESLLRKKFWDYPDLGVGEGFPIRVKKVESVPDGAPAELFLKQGYTLKIKEDEVIIACEQREGLANALSTLKQTIKSEGEYCFTLCDIEDWPLVENRSVSNCLTWYSGYGRMGFDMQLFGYEEWLEYLNVCADLKINQFNMCIYGYWPIEMPGYPESEFRNVRVKVYNPESDSAMWTTFTHPNLAEEFLTRLIADGHELGVKMYAYMGLNSYSGGYACVHREKRMVLPEGSPYINDFDRLCFSKKENMDYMKECVCRVATMGFDGICFEESEEASWFCACDECAVNFLKGGATPSDAMYAASFGLFEEIRKLVKKVNPNCVIGIRAFRQQPLVKSPEDIERMKRVLPEDVVLFWAPGLYVPESEFTKWVDTFGKERIVGRDTESNGVSACFGRLIRIFKTNGLRCDSESLQQYIEEDVRQHMGSASHGVKGTNGFMFEWYGFFLHLMVHANYPWGGTMDPDEFYREATIKIFGKQYAEDILYALKNMLTIHESQLNIFAQYLPFAAHKVEPGDIPEINGAKERTVRIINDLECIYADLKEQGARASVLAHLRKLLIANRRNMVIYDMALTDLSLLKATGDERRTLLLQLKKLNAKDFDLVKANYFDVYPMDTTGIRSCMIPCHELDRIIDNELNPDDADPNMIYLGVEALGWM